MDIKLKLKSDFSQNYDSQFDLDGIEFRRMTTEGPDRIEMINLFRKLGLKTPLFGQYQDFVEHKYSEGKYIVVYTDINKHCGEGKERKLFKSISSHDNQYLMAFIDTFDDQYFARSTRLLFIGNSYCFKYDYCSRDDWRSNCGEVEITEPIKICVPLWRQDIHYPLFAIDFVKHSRTEELLAIDFNCAPGMGDLFAGILKSYQIVDAIKEWYKDG